MYCNIKSRNNIVTLSYRYQSLFKVQISWVKDPLIQIGMYLSCKNMSGMIDIDCIGSHYISWFQVQKL